MSNEREHFPIINDVVDYTNMIKGELFQWSGAKRPFAVYSIGPEVDCFGRGVADLLLHEDVDVATGVLYINPDASVKGLERETSAGRKNLVISCIRSKAHLYAVAKALSRRWKNWDIIGFGYSSVLPREDCGIKTYTEEEMREEIERLKPMLPNGSFSEEE